MSAIKDIEASTDSVDELVSFPNIVTVESISLDGFSVCKSVNIPGIVGITGPDGLYISNMPALTSLSFPALNSIASIAVISDDVGVNSLLSSVDLPVLHIIASDTYCRRNPLLQSFNAPVWVPNNHTTIDFSNNSLSTTSVQQILRRCVLAGVTTCVIKLSGGTNSGVASLNAQGHADVVTLGAQLTINP